MSITYYSQENSTTEEEIDVGSYGKKWLNFMKENHPKLVREMQRNQTLSKVAESVDDEAWDYRELLDKQYEKANPRPTEFYETVAWERTRAFYTDGAVMRERVLVPHTSE